MTKKFPYAWWLVLALAVGTSGCMSALAVFPTAQSHYVPGEARIVPLGPSEGTAEHFEVTFGGLVDLLDPNAQQKAIQEAIQQKHGDLLTDYVLSFYAVRAAIPGIDLLTIWWVHWKAEGVVAKVEGGQAGPPSGLSVPVLPNGSPLPKIDQEPKR